MKSPEEIKEQISQVGKNGASAFLAMAKTFVIAAKQYEETMKVLEKISISPKDLWGKKI